MAELAFIDRVDDAILVQASQIAKLRRSTIRGALDDFRQSCVEILADSRGTPDEDIWRLRIDRCDMLAAEPNDAVLRSRAMTAVEREH